ncbi:hypothetical protein LPJ61_002498 [Coemansia biformis]|uniref:PH domain-containing protein n=1 Tax=Coemansia biformis TaxID=1286918 RepID=A0A9W8CX58_9FUNG|nr:hypothetical protein LPJ61_002498 [Coemansia biformis]
MAQQGGELAPALRYLDALEVFTRGSIEQVKALIPRWMAAYKHSAADGADPLISSCTPLHLAVQCPRKEVVVAILESVDPQVPVDAPDASGMTALHLATKAARKDVVRLLLRHGADDMAQDAQGQDPLAYAAEPDVAAVLQEHRSELAYSCTTELYELARNRDAEGIERVLSDAHKAQHVYVMARDLEGATLLHVAVKNGLLGLAKWAIAEGVDVFARDGLGNMAVKYADQQQMRELLSQAPVGNVRTALMDDPPRLSGELYKWTNYAGGWKPRWFELDDGVLSYYKNQADAESACRGAISTRIARITMAKDKLQFEVQGKGSVRYRLKADDPGVAKQWVHILNVSKQWALEKQARQQPPAAGESAAASVAASVARLPADSDAASLPAPLDSASGRQHHGALLRRPKAADPTATKPATPQLRAPHLFGANASPTSPGSLTASSPSYRAATAPADGAASNRSASDVPSSPAGSVMSNESDDELCSERDAFAAALAELRSQLFIQDRLLEGLSKSTDASTGVTSVEDIAKYYDMASQAVAQAHTQTASLDKVYRATTRAWQIRMRKEQERVDMLADSLRSAVVSSQTLLETMQSKQPREQPDAPMPAALEAASTCMSTFGFSMALGAGGADTASVEDEDDAEFADATDEFFDAATNVVSLNASRGHSPPASLRRSTTVETVPKELETAAKGAQEPAVEVETETVVVDLAPAETDLTALSGYSLPVRVRDELPLITRGGPSLNLWSIIRGAIGKDLSKVSVPVFFNEPTSFLQRFTEDMEYCDLLEIATLLPRSEDRTLFVAGFAMSNYASTFGRIAKPFNPLLGETFEYVRRDKKYRALSEQVEHHPPISACWVEGKNYLYHADTNIKSKFNSGSLTVVPTGVCHVELRLPLSFLDRSEERSAGQPKQPPKINEAGGYFTEHYTWNKLTTNVNGIMIANFWIEHVGDLDVVNHRTGDQTKITFMQSGWTGKNKFKVAGEALNRRGEKVHDIAGDWTSRLVARPVAGGKGTDSSEAEPIQRPARADDSVSAGDAVLYAATNTIDVPSKPFVLWKINERPMENNTYKLTTFAMSLNDKPAELAPYLCPTDSRFRPDQLAMETGEYEQADVEKSRLENKQRATRRQREQGELEPWKPRWFVRSFDDDSGESYWRLNGEYWDEREKAAARRESADQPSIGLWTNVEDIF